MILSRVLSHLSFLFLNFKCVLLFHYPWFVYNVSYPKNWKDPDCNISDVRVFDEGDQPHPHGIYGDELDNDRLWSYFPSNGRNRKSKPRRKIYNGIKMYESGGALHYPFLNICAIKEKDDKYLWCTCMIVHEIWVLTAKECFKNRAQDAEPQCCMPPIKITYGGLKLWQHPNKRFPTEIHFHPNEDIHVSLIKLDRPIVLNKRMAAFHTFTWIKTTAYQNFVPKCSTFTCGYVSNFQKNPFAWLSRKK